MSLKKILIYIPGVLVLLFTFYICDRMFLRDWRYEWKQSRTKKQMERNYYKHKSDFEELFEFTKDLKPFDEIESFGDDKFYALLSQTGDIFSPSFDITYIEEEGQSLPHCSEFEILKNGKLAFYTNDSIIFFQNWTWYYGGNKNDECFEEFLAVANLTESQFFKLRELTRKVNCYAISKHEDHSISIKYLYGWEYFIPRNKALIPEEYSHFSGLEDGIYYGFTANDWLCHFHY